jgi:hypothetical protein
LDFRNGFAITLELVPLDKHKDSKFSFFKEECLIENFLLILVFLLFVATDKNNVHIYQVSNSVVSELK